MEFKHSVRSVGKCLLEMFSGVNSLQSCRRISFLRILKWHNNMRNKFLFNSTMYKETD